MRSCAPRAGVKHWLRPLRWTRKREGGKEGWKEGKSEGGWEGGRETRREERNKSNIRRMKCKLISYAISLGRLLPTFCPCLLKLELYRNQLVHDVAIFMATFRGGSKGLAQAPREFVAPFSRWRQNQHPAQGASGTGCLEGEPGTRWGGIFPVAEGRGWSNHARSITCGTRREEAPHPPSRGHWQSDVPPHKSDWGNSPLKGKSAPPHLFLPAPRQGQGQRLWGPSTLSRSLVLPPHQKDNPQCPRKFCGVSEEQGSLIPHQAGAQSYVRARARQWSGKRRAGSDWCSDFSQEGNQSRDEKRAVLGG